MKYCPHCGAEYHDDVAECRDCRFPLVDERPQRSLEELTKEWQHIEPVIVHTAAAVIDAEVILATLRAYDIRAFIAGTGAEVWTDAGGIGQATRIPGPLNSIRIMVHPDDADRAGEILDSAEQPRADAEATLAPTKWSLDEVRRKRVIKIVAVVLLAPMVWVIVVQFLDAARNL